MKLGVMAIARPTFDVPFAEEVARTAFDVLVSSEIDIAGRAALAMSLEDVSEAAAELKGAGIDALVILQATFADSSLAVAASDVDVPVVLLETADVPLVSAGSNNAADPGETVTFNVDVENAGTLGATAISGALTAITPAERLTVPSAMTLDEAPRSDGVSGVASRYVSASVMSSIISWSIFSQRRPPLMIRSDLRITG